MHTDSNIKKTTTDELCTVQLQKPLHKTEYLSCGSDDLKPSHCFTFLPRVTSRQSQSPIKVVV